MSLRFIGSVVAAALVITIAGNAPARANEDLTKALLAIAGVAIVGKIISDRLEDQNKAKVESRRVARANTTLDNPNWQDWDQWVPNARRLEPRPLPASVRRKLLPGDCLRSFDTSGGRQVIFGKKCLQENYAFNDSLPKACAVKFRTHQKKRRGYDAKCLRHKGYQLARN